MKRTDNHEGNKRVIKPLSLILAAFSSLLVLALPAAAQTKRNPDLNPDNGWGARCGQWWGGGKTLSTPFSLGDWWGGYASGDSKWEGGAWYQEVKDERSGESYVSEVGYEAPANARIPLAGAPKELHVTEKDGQTSICLGALTWAGNIVAVHMQYADGSWAGFVEIYFFKGGLNNFWCHGNSGWQPSSSARNFMYFMQPNDRFVKSLWTDRNGWRHWVIDLSGLLSFMDDKSKVDAWCLDSSSIFRKPADIHLNDAYIHHLNAYGEAGNLFGKCWNGPSWARWRVKDISVVELSAAATPPAKASAAGGGVTTLKTAMKIGGASNKRFAAGGGGSSAASAASASNLAVQASAAGGGVTMLNTDMNSGEPSPGSAAEGGGSSAASAAAGAGATGALAAGAKGGSLAALPGTGARSAAGGSTGLRAGGRRVGAFKQLGLVQRDQKGAASSAAAGRTYDGNAQASAQIAPDAGTPGGGTPGQTETAASGGGQTQEPPPVEGSNVTPWQGAINTALLLMAAACVLLLLANLVGKMSHTLGTAGAKVLAIALAAIAAACGLAVIFFGSMIGGGSFGQPLQGAILSLAGGLITASAVAAALGLAHDGVLKGGYLAVTMVCGGAALAAAAWAYLSAPKQYPAGTFQDGRPPDWNRKQEATQASRLPSQGILDRYLA